MKIVENMIEKVKEELEGARCYAEKYLEHKARGDSARAGKYREMAQDEMHHAAIVHDFATMDIESLRKIYTLPVDTEEHIQHMHKHYAECVAMVKHMLA